jgi:hypothetical protein
MRRIVLLAISVLAVAIYPAMTLAGPGGSDSGVKCVFTTQLLAENEAPHVSTSEAFGHTQIKIRNDNTVEWNTHIVNPAGENFVAGHVHKAPVGVAGPVLVPLFSGATTDAQIKDTGEAAASSAALADDICANPQNYYVNYHTNPGFPAGAIRGQLG